MNIFSKRTLILLVTILVIAASIVSISYAGASTTPAQTAERFECPPIHNPGPIEGLWGWGKIFEPTYLLHAGGPTVYGVNIWQVQERNLVSSIQNMVAQGGPGLVISGGQIHSVDIYLDEASELFTVVFIYEWESNIAEVADTGTPISIVWTILRFYPMVEAYNWTMVTELEPDLSAYADMIDVQFKEEMGFPMLVRLQTEPIIDPF